MPSTEINRIRLVALDDRLLEEDRREHLLEKEGKQTQARFSLLNSERPDVDNTKKSLM